MSFDTRPAKKTKLDSEDQAGDSTSSNSVVATPPTSPLLLYMGTISFTPINANGVESAALRNPRPHHEDHEEVMLEGSSEEIESDMTIVGDHEAGADNMETDTDGDVQEVDPGYDGGDEDSEVDPLDNP